MIREWFDLTQVDALALHLLHELRRSYPPAQVGREIGAKRQQELDRRIEAHLRAFSREHRLNVYQKARLGTRLSSVMTEAGYPETFSRNFSYQVTTLFALVASSPAKS